MKEFKLVSNFPPRGDQPEAIKQLVAGLEQGLKEQVLLGVTGSGKTFTMANVIAQVKKPTLVISHNKTLAAQLCNEFREFFPENRVGYFISYYDYYQPEAYIPQTDTYIEKEVTINEEIDRLRHWATSSILEERDVIIVASVSCIYGLGSPQTYSENYLSFQLKKTYPRQAVLKKLVNMQFERNNLELKRGNFRFKGDTLEIYPATEEVIICLSFWGDEVEQITVKDPVSQHVLRKEEYITIPPAKHFLTDPDQLARAFRGIEDELAERLAKFEQEGRLLEAERLRTRTNYDLELLSNTGYCPGVENYSRHLDGRAVGSRPFTLLDYFPDDYLLIIDESHVTLPQIRGMSGGDSSRKKVLVEHGFRLPSALDNRPLKFDEFNSLINQVVYVSATPCEYEKARSQQIVEQIIRPTGLVDPEINIHPVEGQVDHLIGEIRKRVAKRERVLVTTLTKKTAEDLARYLQEIGIKVTYLHSEIDSLKRIEVIRNLRLGEFDVLVGVNLLREGLDLPEVSLVGILDADKEGFLRSETSLIQTMGRTARHVSGEVLLYADVLTNSIQKAIQETHRRRQIQLAYNKEHGITPESIKKAVRDILADIHLKEETKFDVRQLAEGKEIEQVIKQLEKEMSNAAKNLEFEKAAAFRDEIFYLKKTLAEIKG